MILYQDSDLENRIVNLKNVIKSWAMSHNLWYDCGFKSWMEHFDDEPPEHPIVLVMWYEGPLYNVMNSDDELLEQLTELIEKTEFGFERYDLTSSHFWVNDNNLQKSYREYYEWQWILDLIKPDYDSIYEEIYERFYRKPEDLQRLEWRKFEQLLDGIFRNNGYRTVLGSGQNDGGVDLRLYSNDVVGEILTLVQAKRYAPNRPIELEAVKALSATVEDEKANRGLFVTTSRFLPVAERFAHRQNQRLILGTSSDIQQWAQQASQSILRDKSNLVSPSTLQILLEGKNNSGLEGKIFHAYSHSYIYNSIFTLVLKESKGAVLLLKLPERILTGDFQRGTHVPEVNLQLSCLTNAHIFRAKKKMNERGELYLWGSQKLFTLWDETPKHFDRMD